MPTVAEIKAAIAARQQVKEDKQQESSKNEEGSISTYTVEPSSIYVDPPLFLHCLAWWIKHPTYPQDKAASFIHFFGGYFIMCAAKRDYTNWLIKYLPTPTSAEDYYKTAVILWWVEMNLPKELHSELENMLKKEA